ncbi:MAG: hypothetical protein M3Z41_02700 [Candidatus Eremiobacteraeota bacterium]|nr:hypothetical protein [Candidatus Eremiobacteraeota bacterium]
MTGSKRAESEWYQPYFAPTTVIIAVSVLFLSWETGKYAGNYYIQRDKTDALITPLSNVAPAAHMIPAKAVGHTKAHRVTPGKTQP